jgi:Ca-activated chloride channel family protein
MHLLNKKLSAIAVLVAGSAAGWALYAQQQPSTGAEDSGAVIRVDTRLIVCHTTVVDKTGHLVTNLPESAFTVYEDGVKQDIKVFKREDVPVSIGLVVDNSGSMRDKRAKVAAAALALVRASNKEDESFVVNFNDEAFLDLPHNKEFTNDLTELEEALSRIDSRGGTATRDAIRMSIDWVKEKGHRDQRVQVVVTDGNDNSSVISLENLVKAAQQAGVLIYSVGLLSEEERREATKAKRALLDLAEATGAEAFFPKELAEVDHIAAQVAHDIRNQYTIAYTPSNPAMDGKFRSIKVAVNAPGKPTVRTRNGYYATPDQGLPPSSHTSAKK